MQLNNKKQMKRIFSIFSALFLVFALIHSCQEEAVDEERKAQEERYFDLYMQAKHPGLSPLENGLYYKQVEEGTGVSPDSGDFVLINYVAFSLPQEIIVDTYDEAWAEEANLYVNTVMYGPYKYEVGTEIDGLDLGVMMMQEGEIARLIFKSDLGYGATGYSNTIQPYSSLIYDVHLQEVIGDPDAYQQKMINGYLDTVSNAQAYYDEETESYYYYIEDEAGTGDLLEEDDELTIYYRGSLLDGRIFDENFEGAGGLDVVIGTTSLIRGWTIGLTRFRYGGTGRLLIPYELAYGEEGELAAGTNKYSIPPYEPLLFEITVPEEETEE